MEGGQWGRVRRSLAVEGKGRAAACGVLHHPPQVVAAVSGAGLGVALLNPLPARHLGRVGQAEAA